MSHRTRLTRLEEIIDERRASSRRCVCCIVHIQAGIEPTIEVSAQLERNRLCRQSAPKAHVGFTVVEIAPRRLDRAEEISAPIAS